MLGFRNNLSHYVTVLCAREKSKFPSPSNHHHRNRIKYLSAIHYNEWLPAILPHKAMKEFELYKKVKPAYAGDSGTDPAISMVFSTAAYRFGHTLIPDGFFLKTIIQMGRSLQWMTCSTSQIRIER